MALVLYRCTLCSHATANRARLCGWCLRGLPPPIQPEGRRVYLAGHMGPSDVQARSMLPGERFARLRRMVLQRRRIRAGC